MSHIPNQRMRSKAPKLTQSVVFQFVLSEFLELNQITAKIHNFIQVPENSANWKHLFHDLIGSPSATHAWEEEQGKILKLQELCNHLVEVQQSKNIHIKKLPPATQHLLNVAIKCFHAAPASQRSQWDRMTRRLGEYKGLITKVIDLFCQDENVLLYLLKNHQRIDQVFGGAFVFQTFQKHLSSDKKDMQEFLVHRYQQRGFQRLESLIRSKIDELAINEYC